VRRKRNDEFGDLIRPEEFLKAEERDDDGLERREMKREEEEGIGKKRKWDDLGKKTNANNKRPQLNRTVSEDVAISLPSDGGSTAVDDELDGAEDEEEEPNSMGPSRLVVTKEDIPVHLRIAVVDFSGLHDKRSLNMLIPLIAPRKLILVSGNEEETMALAADCRKLLGADTTRDNDSSAKAEVLTPGVGISVDASVDTNAWVVKLADPLVRRLKWQNVRGLGIVTVTARLVGAEGNADTHPHLPVAAEEEATAAHKRLKTEDGENASTDEKDATTLVVPTLDVLPLTMVAASRAVAQPLHVGDLRLADLRRAMQTAGHTAEFRGEGTLLIDGAVAVRKSATGRIEVESIGLPAAGVPSRGETFWAVKRMIYDGLAVVAGA
jgi:cleavage and polyadenylation specificity factor subunit 2